MKLSIVMPVYNEIGTIAEIMRRVRTVGLMVPVGYGADNGATIEFEREVVVVDDGSEDGTRDVAWLRERGVTVYGFVPRWMRDEDARGIHGPDEKISIRNLKRGAETLVRLIENFDELDR